jgi:hypothetical protein
MAARHGWIASFNLTLCRLTPPIFHYTDAGGFKGIIENDNIWLTERTHLNDPTELAYGLKYALDRCDQHVDVNDRLARVFFGSFQDGLARTLNAVGAYVTSFSLGGNVLSQWRRYADDGRGFCLELNVDVRPALHRSGSWSAR